MKKLRGERGAGVMRLARRAGIAATVFGVGVLVPVVARALNGPGMALRSLPVAILLVLIGGGLWLWDRRGL